MASAGTLCKKLLKVKDVVVELVISHEILSGNANSGEADAERRHFWNRCGGVRNGSGNASS